MESSSLPHNFISQLLSTKKVDVDNWSYKLSKSYKVLCSLPTLVGRGLDDNGDLPFSLSPYSCFHGVTRGEWYGHANTVAARESLLGHPHHMGMCMSLEPS